MPLVIYALGDEHKHTHTHAHANTHTHTKRIPKASQKKPGTFWLQAYATSLKQHKNKQFLVEQKFRKIGYLCIYVSVSLNFFDHSIWFLTQVVGPAVFFPGFQNIYEPIVLRIYCRT